MSKILQIKPDNGSFENPRNKSLAVRIILHDDIDCENSFGTAHIATPQDRSK